MPSALTERATFLFQHFRSLSYQNHMGQKEKRYAKISDVKYHFTSQPKIKALTTAPNVWDKCIEHPRIKAWELGQFLPLDKARYIDYVRSGKPLDTVKKHGSDG